MSICTNLRMALSAEGEFLSSGGLIFWRGLIFSGWLVSPDDFLLNRGGGVAAGPGRYPRNRPSWAADSLLSYGGHTPFSAPYTLLMLNPGASGVESQELPLWVVKGMSQRAFHPVQQLPPPFLAHQQFIFQMPLGGWAAGWIFAFGGAKAGQKYGQKWVEWAAILNLGSRFSAPKVLGGQMAFSTNLGW